MALILTKHGYYYLLEGKTLFLDISYILNKRYSPSLKRGGPIKNIDSIIEDIFNMYQLIFLKNPPFNIENSIPLVDNVRNFRLENKSDLPKTIYIYEYSKLIKGSPFGKKK